MRMFLRKSSDRRDPLAIAMIGLRLGERLLQVGHDDPAALGALAAKVGITGHAAVVTFDERTAERARDAVANAGALADVSTTPDGTLAFEAASFDVGVIHGTGGLLASLDAATRGRLFAELLRVLRPGGRLIAIDPGARTGLKAMFAPAPKVDEQYEQAGGTTTTMEAAGFRPVRLLADRDGCRFIEGLRSA